jgi:hypothetical protein
MPRTIIGSDFTHHEKRRVAAEVKKANTNNNPYLTKAEAAVLPKDLHDNFEAFRKSQGNKVAVAAKFVDAFSAQVDVAVPRADLNGDGKLDPSERNRLPNNLRDNAAAYYRATHQMTKLGTYVAKSRPELLTKIEEELKSHDFKDMLPLFNAWNRGVQAELGINDFQYIAEGIGLGMADAPMPAPITRQDTLELITDVKLERKGQKVAGISGLQIFNGSVTLQDGTRRDVSIWVQKVPGGYELAPPVG